MKLSLKGKTVLITGSTDGVGRQVALEMASAGARLLVHGRNQQRGTQLLGHIEQAGSKGSVFYPADFSSLQEVHRLAQTVLDNHSRLDILINNAGIGTGRSGESRQITPEGHELKFVVNYLSGFLLTHLLLPLLQVSAPSRIVNVSSVGQQAIDFSDVMLSRGYSGARAYCQSKLAQIMFTIDLAQELQGKGVTANALHPATYMNTTMVRESGVAPMSTVKEGADAILYLATSPALEGKSGLYFDGTRPSRANTQSNDIAARRQLRDLSLQLVGLS